MGGLNLNLGGPGLGIAGLAGIAGGLLNQNKTDITGPTGPALDLYNTLKNYYGQAMNNTPNFMQGYEQGGLNSIQKGVQANQQGAMNANASHGVRGAAAAYASTVPTVAGQSQVANLETSLPMVRSQYQNSIMDRALQGVKAGPQSTQLQGSPLGGAFAGLATALAGMYGKNSMNNGGGGGYYGEDPGIWQYDMPNAEGSGGYNSSDPLAGGLPNGQENYIPGGG